VYAPGAIMDYMVAGGIVGTTLLVVGRRHLARTQLVHVGTEADFAPASADLEYAVIEYGERWKSDDVLVVRRTSDRRLFAICNSCPHAGYPLHEGDIEDMCKGPFGHAIGPVVSCPAHAYLFDMQRGTCISEGKCPPTPVYRAQMRGRDLYLSREPISGGEIGTRALSRADANALQLQMVDLALAKKYGSRE
jgi:nitrite reductase/ring-hydroxylating ferredoxin subunit